MKNFLLAITAVMMVSTTSSNAGAVEYSSRDLECMAKNIYFEARGESERGQIMIAEVTLNRMNNGKFPDTVCGVVYQPSQFNWTDGSQVISEKALYNKVKNVAKAVLEGDVKLSKTGALYFKRTGSRSSFHDSRPHVVRVGNHDFYR